MTKDEFHNLMERLDLAHDEWGTTFYNMQLDLHIEESIKSDLGFIVSFDTRICNIYNPDACMAVVGGKEVKLDEYIKYVPSDHRYTCMTDIHYTFLQNYISKSAVEEISMLDKDYEQQLENCSSTSAQHEYEQRLEAEAENEGMVVEHGFSKEDFATGNVMVNGKMWTGVNDSFTDPQSGDLPYSNFDSGMDSKDVQAAIGQDMIEITSIHGTTKEYIKNPLSSTCSQGEDLTKCSSVDDSFTWEQYDEWVSNGDRKEIYSKPKKDHSKFIQQVEDNELSKDEIVKYLKENL